MLVTSLKLFTSSLLNEAVGSADSGMVLLIVGDSNTSGDTFLTDFLRNADAKDRSVYLSMLEPPGRLVRKLENCWHDINSSLRDESLTIFNLALPRREVPKDVARNRWTISVGKPDEPSDVLSTYRHKLSRTARKNNQKFRLVFDSASLYNRLVGDREAIHFFRQLIALTRTSEDTLLIRVHPEMQDESFIRTLEAQSDVVIKLEEGEDGEVATIKKGFNPDYLYKPMTYETKDGQVSVSEESD